MATDSNTISPEPRRFSIRLPRPLWIGLATAMLIGASVAVADESLATALNRIGAIPGRDDSGDIVSLSFGESDMSGDEVVLLRRLDHLQEVSFFNCRKITASAMAEIQRLRVRELVINETPIDRDAIRLLGQIQTLRSLLIDEKHVSDADVTTLENLPILESLRIMSCPISGRTLGNFRSLPKLRELDLRGTGVVDPALESLAKTKDLRVLSLSSTRVRDEAMVHLRQLEKIEKVDLSSTFVSDRGLLDVGTLGSLKDLDLGRQIQPIKGEQYGRIGDAGMAHLAGLKGLRSLNLRYTQVTSEGLRHLGGLSELQELDLCGTRVDEKGIAHLTSLGKLETLLISETSTFTDRGLQYLIDLEPLKHVSVVFTSVTSKAVREFEKRRPDVRIEFR
jgi:internalin A